MNTNESCSALTDRFNGLGPATWPGASLVVSPSEPDWFETGTAVTIGFGTLTVNAFQPLSVPSFSINWAYRRSLPPAVPGSNTVLATSAGATSILWPPV